MRNAVRRLKSNIKSQSGSAILSSLMYAAMIMIVSVSLIDFLTLRAHDRGAVLVRTQRDLLMYHVRHDIRVGLNIYASMALPGNTDLKKCIVFDRPNGDSPDQCMSNYHASNYKRAVTFIQDGGIPISGRDAGSAVKYTLDGEVCVAPAKCEFSVWTEFIAYCPNDGWWSCGTAKALLVDIHIKQISDHANLNEKIEQQYVSVMDWSFGQWSVIGYSSDDTPQPPPSSVLPTPTPTPNPGGGAGVGVGAPAPTPTPVVFVPPDPTPFPVPPPKDSCGAGQALVNNTCTRFSM